MYKVESSKGGFNPLSSVEQSYVIPRELVLDALNVNPHTFSWYLSIVKNNLRGHVKYRPYQKEYDQKTVEILRQMISLFKTGKTQKQVVQEIKQQYPKEVKTCTFKM